MKNKLKWFYDQQNQESYTLETYPYANNGFSIQKSEFGYLLTWGTKIIKHFKYKKSAIKVAELIAFE